MAPGQDMFLQVALTRTVLDGTPSLLAVLLAEKGLKRWPNAARWLGLRIFRT